MLGQGHVGECTSSIASPAAEGASDLVDEVAKPDRAAILGGDRFVGLELSPDPTIGGMDGRVRGSAKGGGDLGEARIRHFAGKVGTEPSGQHHPTMSSRGQKLVSIHADRFTDHFDDPLIGMRARSGARERRMFPNAIGEAGRAHSREERRGTTAGRLDLDR